MCPILREPMNSSPGISQVALVVKKLPASVGDKGDAVSIPGLGRTSGWGQGNPLQYSCLENPMDRRAWQATVQWVAKSGTWLKWLTTQARTLANQVSLSMNFPGKNTGVGQPYSSPGDLSKWEIEPRSPALAADSLPSNLQRSPGSLDKTKEKY